MSCSTNFIGSSSPGHYVQHCNLDCRDTLYKMFTKKYAEGKINHLAHVTITKKTDSFQNSTSYNSLSHKQFRCLLRCGISEDNEIGYKNCNEACSKIFENV
jgi:hypothetical protein